MKNTGKVIGYGVLLWLSIFVGAMIIFKLHESDRAFFETLISIICTIAIIIFTIMYFKKIDSDYQLEGWKIGIVWMLINLIIDIPMFSFGAMARPLWEYFTDIGFMYISIPVITVGTGFLLEKKLMTHSA